MALRQLTHQSAAGMSFTLRTVESSTAFCGEASALTRSAPRRARERAWQRDAKSSCRLHTLRGPAAPAAPDMLQHSTQPLGKAMHRVGRAPSSHDRARTAKTTTATHAPACLRAQQRIIMHAGTSAAALASERR